jgi:tetratricopeptide (TPR) repeat protein
MTKVVSFDRRSAHEYFSAYCFNKAWDLLDKPQRSAEENEEMIRLSQASLWHWTQREDCTNRNMSIGYWQASRIYASLGAIEEARRLGEVCMRYSKNEPPFFLGYAYEALARAEKLSGNTAQAEVYLKEASRLAELVKGDDDQKQLFADIASLRH